jgi:molecular chaperone HtpG
MRKGNISVKTQDILPIIKKWLYSEHDIFVRELISNSSDAITKRHTLASGTNQEVPAGKIQVMVDKKNSTLTFSDNGLGMTEEEVEKYLAQLAFSGAAEFVEKMKAQGNTNAKDEIIGKFGLGFYSAFMVADEVTVESLSMTPGSQATKWTCLGDVEYEFSPGTRTEVGTTITLKINADSQDFLNAWKVRETLSQYCAFMPYPIELVDLNKGADGKVDLINDSAPLWKKDPTTLKDEDYKEFYRKMFPMDQEPLFWLHLNVDHPFTLQGVLFFPKVNMQKPMQEQGIKLFSKQVFVSDNVKSILPDFLQLLKGAIDSTDIPLNVSRSALQGDPNVKKISNYVVKKVAESLKKLFNSDRERFEKVWEDVSLFAKYGSVSDNKFDEMVRPYVLFKNADNKLVTIEEYAASVPAAYVEKMKGKVLYFDMKEGDENLRRQLLAEGIQTISTDQMIDPHWMQHSEMTKVGEQEWKFVAMDAEVENLLQESATTEDDVKIRDFFKEVLGTSELMDVEVKGLKNATSAAYFKIDEQMRRFQQMTRSMGQSNFPMPIKKTLVVNPTNSLVQNAWKLWDKPDHKELARKIATHVQDLATLSSEGLPEGQKEAFVGRSQQLIQELSLIALRN